MALIFVLLALLALGSALALAAPPQPGAQAWPTARPESGPKLLGPPQVDVRAAPLPEGGAPPASPPPAAGTERSAATATPYGTPTIDAKSLPSASPWLGAAARSTLPAKPTNVTATALSTAQIRLSWTDNATDESGYIIARWGGSSWYVLYRTGANATTVTVSGLAAGITYYYYVGAYNSAGISWADNYVQATTGSNLPAKPTNVTATSISSSQIRLSWTDNASNESGYVIARWTGSSWYVIYRTAANVTTVTNSGLAAGKTYYYYVGAYNSSGVTWADNYVQATTGSILPAKPTNVSATALSSSQIRLNWRDNAANETGYVIVSWTGSSWQEAYRTGANVTTLTSSGLVSGTTYYYYVGAYNASGVSWADNYVSATTHGATSRPEVIVDDLSDGFSKGGTYWWQANVGYNAHMWWTYVSPSMASSWGEWKANLVGGSYEVLAFVPAYNASTRNARYEVDHQGGSTVRAVNQNVYYNAWVSLGTYVFPARSVGQVRLTDATGESGGLKVGFDAVKFVPR